MTLGSVMGILLTLGFVLALLGVALKLLRRFAPTSTTGARLRMEVVQRLALGPKQGIAVIRVGERMVAVSVGDGGIRRLFELDEAEVSATANNCVAARSQRRAYRRADGLQDDAQRRVAHGRHRPGGSRVVVRHGGAAGWRPARCPAHAACRAKAVGCRTKPATAATSTPTSAPARTAAVTAPKSPIDAAVSKLTPQMDLRVGGGGNDGLRLSGTVGVVVMMGLLTLLPMLLLMMTGFTRILIVLNFLKQALGTQSAPPNQLVAGLALLLTGFVMAPTLNEVNRTAITPWMDGQIDQATMLDLGSKPLRAFMLRQTRRNDIETFVRMSAGPRPATIDDVPLVTLTSAYVISELRTAFQIGFALFLPFIVIDVAVSSVLMSMGMFMLPPAMISLPFKLLLFVLVDGWSLITQSLVSSFR